MKISEAITRLQTIQKQYGDLQIVGSSLMDDSELGSLHVVDVNGVSVWDSEKTNNVPVSRRKKLSVFLDH